MRPQNPRRVKPCCPNPNQKQQRSGTRGLAQTTEPPGQKPLLVNEVVVGPFEEEEEGRGIANDTVKVEVEIRPPQFV